MSELDDRHSPLRRRTLRIVGGAVGAAAAGAVATGGCARERDPNVVTSVSIDMVPPGERMRVDHQGDPVEVHRTDDGVVARVLLCTHVRCEVFWYDREAVYHCPCHAARFDARGRPLSGPIEVPLVEIEAWIKDAQIHIRG
jgi:Rieske Fe-S protein